MGGQGLMPTSDHGQRQGQLQCEAKDQGSRDHTAGLDQECELQ